MAKLALYHQTMTRLKDIGDDVFKQAFLDYLETNEHDLDWEGFKQRDLYGFGVVIRDFLLAWEAGGLKGYKGTL